MVLEQVRRLDRLFVAAIDQRDAFAVERDERHFGQRLRGRRDQRRHLRSRAGGVLGPARGLAHVDKREVGALPGQFGEQRRLLGAADHDLAATGRDLAEAFDLGAAEIAPGLDVRATAAAFDRALIERHGVFAGTHQDGAFFRHFGSGLGRGAPTPMAAATARL